ncbi:uncharacterized protein LOC141633942 [Silene latifolia]|uniref:uncharacterized protein LOC141633942 n=1 Tax=Silene latifolia TaxID=37657 RepID=UPI003D778D30
MSSKIRKHESGYEKRKKKKRIEELIQSQKGALDRFIIKPPHNTPLNETPNCDVNIDSQTPFGEEGIIEESSENSIDDVQSDSVHDDNHVLSDRETQKSTDYVKKFGFDIFDPRNWDALDSKMVDVIAEEGLRRDMTIDKGPRDERNRYFSSTYYTRILPNGEKFDRDWLVYSKELDRVFCFCCKVFGKTCARRGRLATDGYDDWPHLSSRLKEHESSSEHVHNMSTWYDLRWRLQNNQTIDSINQTQIKKEKDRWNQVLLRIISIVKFLAKHNLAFRGHKERLYQGSNGNFLGLIEMLAEFDPIVQEHVRRITNQDLHFHYLGHRVQNELILLLASQIKSEIIRKIKQAKYFSVILDCTPDTSHQEQMTMILRYVDVSSKSVVIEESFMGFLDVDDTTGQGLFDVLQVELKNMGLDIDDVRGQGYDNGSNMKGKHQGVQKKLIDINPRAYYMPCGCHSLNLTLCDMAETCGKARDFFGTIQRIYTIFANSNKRWKILEDNVKKFTLKPLSVTRWESRVESVKAIRFQLGDIREALLDLAEKDNDTKVRSEAKSLALNELGDFEFLVAIILWYEMLYHVNLVSKHLQSKSMLIDIAIKEMKGLITFFEEFREIGLENAIEEAKKIAIELNINPVFPQRRVIRRKRQFDENQHDQSELRNQSPEESFRVNYFLFIVDQAISSLKWRFEKYQDFENVFGFLFTSERLLSMEDGRLQVCCNGLEDALKKGEQFDIDGNELYMELKFLRGLLPKEKLGPGEMLSFLKNFSCFPNVVIAYRIVLTIPVTVASAERSFSKLKLLKSYLRSTMSQERLNGLALIAIENEILEQIEYKDMINEFASQNARRINIFKQDK